MIQIHRNDHGDVQRASHEPSLGERRLMPERAQHQRQETQRAQPTDVPWHGPGIQRHAEQIDRRTKPRHARCPARQTPLRDEPDAQSSER